MAKRDPFRQIEQQLPCRWGVQRCGEIAVGRLTRGGEGGAGGSSEAAPDHDIEIARGAIGPRQIAQRSIELAGGIIVEQIGEDRARRAQAAQRNARLMHCFAFAPGEQHSFVEAIVAQAPAKHCGAGGDRGMARIEPDCAGLVGPAQLSQQAEAAFRLA